MKKLISVVVSSVLLGTVSVHEAEATVKKPKLEFVQKVSNTTGFLNINSDKEGTVYVYNGKKKIKTAKTDPTGYVQVGIPKQKAGSVLQIFSKSKSGQKSPVLKVTVKGNFKAKTQLSKKKYTLIERNKIQAEFSRWAGAQAKKSRLAFNSRYYNYAFNGQGDWFGVTPQGYIQVQDMNAPGYYAYGLHVLGGGVFYSPKDNQYGYSNDLHDETTTNGYVSVAKPNTTVTKYILGDNGVVYELKKKVNQMNYMTGFAGRTESGKNIAYVLGKNNKLIVSKDKAAQAKYKAILKKYQ